MPRAKRHSKYPQDSAVEPCSVPDGQIPVAYGRLATNEPSTGSESRVPRPTRTVQQAGVIGFRFTERLEFCLVTGRRSGHWQFPKGNVSDHPSAHRAATSEAEEEAGILGTLIGDPLAVCQYVKRNHVRRVNYWLMRVESTSAKWKEAGERRRLWVPPETALTLLFCDQLRGLTLEATSQIDELQAQSPRLWRFTTWPTNPISESIQFD